MLAKFVLNYPIQMLMLGDLMIKNVSDKILVEKSNHSQLHSLDVMMQD